MIVHSMFNLNILFNTFKNINRINVFTVGKIITIIGTSPLIQKLLE